jgi:signal transduction histidine kinase
VFVRDRGVGFDPDAVPADRHGLADSVHGRMERHGGSVRLRSAPGEGTEVHLSMPVDGRTAEHTEPAPQVRAQEESNT